jgi:hypothetical protein
MDAGEATELEATEPTGAEGGRRRRDGSGAMEPTKRQ